VHGKEESTGAKRSRGPALSAVERDPAVSFCPSDRTAPDKSHRPPLCHPATAERCLAEGADVYDTGRRQKELDAAVSQGRRS
jgi:hypothetical protein